MADLQFEIDSLRDQFAKAHLERLALTEPPQLPADQAESSVKCSITFQLLKQWSIKHKSVIQEAIDAEVFGVKSTQIHWSNAFFAFMESSAMYLRDWGMFVDAWTSFRELKIDNEKHPNRMDEVEYTLQVNKAVQKFNAATKRIRELAKVWGMDYIYLTDLVEHASTIHPRWDGPYSGVFVTTSAQKTKPFIGLAFKGTNPLQLREVLVDYNYQLQAAKGYLQNTKVSVGVYTGLFEHFPKIQEKPYEIILGGLEAVGRTLQVDGPVRVHVTGHSLGGSYSQMCYAQMLLNISTNQGLSAPQHIAMGDQYTFGAPRVGSNDWARLNRELVDRSPGLSWRVVDDKDIVPQVPPTTLKPETDFHHIDRGVQIFKNKRPLDMPTEVDTQDPKPYPITDWHNFVKDVFGVAAHLPNFYYESLTYALSHTSSR